MLVPGIRRTSVTALALLLMVVATPSALATFPAANGLIVFQAETDGGTQLFTMKPDGTELRQLTHVEAVPPPELFRQFPGAARPDWSPDGRTIMFTENDCTIAFIDVAGGDPWRVTPEAAGSGGMTICEAGARFAPDGRSIVYERCLDTACAIWTMDVEGRDRKPVTHACAPEAEVSPDGTRIVTKGCSGLMVANLDGTDQRQVTPVLSVARKFDWAPDGSAIAFSDDNHDDSPDAINIATVAPDGTGLRYLTDVEAGSHAYIGSYSPDGASIVYRLDRGEEYALFVLAADGSDVRQITEFSAFRPRYIDWGPAPTTTTP